MKKVQVLGTSDEELRSMIEDIRKYLIEDTEDLETNQQIIGMSFFISGFSMESCDKTCFSDNKHIAYGRIVNKHCTNYCCKF